jgi:single-strand DNA-binding protein
MNVIQIAGHLGADPVTRFTATGQKVTTFTVAVNGRKGGNEVTTWYRVTIWGDRFDKMLPYLKKGSAVIVVGELQKPEIWVDKEGRQQISLEVNAEIIRFSPFGKPERQDQQNQQTPGAQGQGFTGSLGGFTGSGAQRGFGEQTFGGNPQQEQHQGQQHAQQHQGQQQQHGQQQGQQQHGQQQQEEEDQVPF